MGIDGKLSKSGVDLAIIGMGCIFPGAADLESFWTNLVLGQSSICEGNFPEHSAYRNRDGNAENSFGNIYCRKGGFISDLVEFNPSGFGVMPKALVGSDPDQFIALSVARDALADAGYLNGNARATSKIDPRRASVIIGRTAAPGVGAMNLIQLGQTIDQVIELLMAARPDMSPDQISEIRAELVKQLRPCNSDTIPGVMPNILAGRIASLFGWTGKSLVLDAACASSLVALEIASDELRSGRCDLALAGGIHVNSSPYFYQMFCGIGALSKEGVIRPFDTRADGTLLGEGAGMIVLKRLEDAIADADRIYAVVRGIGTASNGQGSGTLAPAVDGEILAMRRALESAGVSPDTIGFIEAHGTATPSGDETELLAIRQVYGNASASRLSSREGQPWCALGSVKANIGHCQAASGIAGLIKASLALHNKIIPASLNTEILNQKNSWNDFPCYINSKSRPWIHPVMQNSTRERIGNYGVHEFGKSTPVKHDNLEISPRRAAVSAFGFGGINSHTILEEYSESIERESTRANLFCGYDSELFFFQSDNSEELAAILKRSMVEIVSAIEDAHLLTSQDSDSTKARKEAKILEKLAKANKKNLDSDSPINGARLAIVASNLDDYLSKIEQSIKEIEEGSAWNIDFRASATQGIYLREGNRKGKENNSSFDTDGKIAFVLPGLGAAYPGMLQELCFHFPEVREVFDFIDALASEHESKQTEYYLPGSNVFPLYNSQSMDSSALIRAHSAVVTVLMAEWALYTVLTKSGIEPDAVMGCSTGEFAAMAISGIVDIVSVAGLFYAMSTEVARSIPKDKSDNLRSLSVAANYSEIVEKSTSSNSGELYLSTQLTPKRSIITGSKESIDDIIKDLEKAGIEFQRLPMAIPYHTPLVENLLSIEPSVLESLPLHPPDKRIWSCRHASALAGEAEEVRELCTDLFKHPVLLSQTIEKMYEEGVRVFIELGPRGGLRGFIGETLQCRPHISLACDLQNRSSITQLNHVLAVLWCHGRKIDFDYLYRRRSSPESAGKNDTSPHSAKLRRKLDLRYPELKVNETIENLLEPARECVESSKESHARPESQSQSQSQSLSQSLSLSQSAATNLISGYLENITILHDEMTSMQERVMKAFIETGDLQDSASDFDRE